METSFIKSKLAESLLTRNGEPPNWLIIVVFDMISLEIGMNAPIFEVIARVIGANVFQLTKVPWIDFIANFGMLSLMFFAGLEVDQR